MTKDQLVAYSLKYDGESQEIRKALAYNEPYEPILDVPKLITILDDAYPESLRNLTEPPYVLYYKGDLSLLTQEAVAIVGSRQPIDYAIIQTQRIVKNLSKSYIIVSGLAKGIDAIAHQEALKESTTIAVLGCGIDRVYPSENKDLYQRIEDKGLILSEYPRSCLPMKHHFPHRNRLVAALGKVVVVTQADLKSGSMITVNEALNLGKDVYTIPYELSTLEGQGCNLLIQQGANMILDEDDILSI
jgi:DNA processing protein